MKSFRIMTLLIGVLMLALGASSALAAPAGKGATVIDVDICAPLIGGGTVCVTSKGMVNETSTPSGNLSYVTNYSEHLLVYDANGQVTWDQTNKEHFHFLMKGDVLQELSWRSRSTITSYGQTYCIEYHIHGANGQDQFVRIDFC